MKQNLLLILGVVMVSAPFSSEVIWTDKEMKTLYQWTVKNSSADWGSPKVNSFTQYTEVPPLLQAQKKPYKYIFDGPIKTNGASWYTYQSVVKTNNTANEWVDSIVTRYSSYLNPAAIVLNESTSIPLTPMDPGLEFQSIVRILSDEKDTINHGVVESSPGSGSYQVNGVYSGETTQLANQFSLWHGVAFRYQGNMINILSQMTYGDSVKLRYLMGKSLSGLSFDSLKVQMIRVDYVTQSVTTPVLSITPELQNNSAFFAIQGRAVQMYTKNLNPAAVFRVYEQNGQLVRSWNLSEMTNSHSILLNSEDFPAGAYVFKLNNGLHVFQTQGVLGN